MKPTFRLPALSSALLVLLLFRQPLAAHEHLAAGATAPEQDAALVFYNAAVFAAESGYVIRLDQTDNGEFGNQYHGELTFVVLPATSDPGGPVDGHPALGSRIETVVESAAGPEGGAFAFWESTEGTGQPAQITFQIPVGETNANFRFPVSENDGSPGTDPFGHIHGRVFSATRPGLYQIGMRFVDISTSGAGSGPWHRPSEPFHLRFQAGVTLTGPVAGDDGWSVSFATSTGFLYGVETADRLDQAVWVSFGEPEAGNDRIRTVVLPAGAETARFFRLRRIPE